MKKFKDNSDTLIKGILKSKGSLQNKVDGNRYLFCQQVDAERRDVCNTCDTWWE